eukprot:5944244-Pleurochrysis_carterae.AAC.1
MVGPTARAGGPVPRPAPYAVGVRRLAPFGGAVGPPLSTVLPSAWARPLQIRHFGGRRAGRGSRRPPPPSSLPRRCVASLGCAAGVG